MNAQIYAVRITACTNNVFREVDGDPVGLYVGNIRGGSWLPMALAASELCDTLEKADALKAEAERDSVGFAFEIVHLTEMKP